MSDFFTNWNKIINPDDDINSMFEQKQCKECIHQGDGFYCNDCIRDDAKNKHDYYDKEE